MVEDIKEEVEEREKYILNFLGFICYTIFWSYNGTIQVAGRPRPLTGGFPGGFSLLDETEEDGSSSSPEVEADTLVTSPAPSPVFRMQLWQCGFPAGCLVRNVS